MTSKSRGTSSNVRRGCLVAMVALVAVAGGIMIITGYTPAALIDRFQWETRCPYNTYYGVTWSPDGERIAYAADPVTKGYPYIDIFLIDIAHPDTPTRLTDNGYARYPVWSADGSGIIYSVYADNDYRLEKIDVKTLTVQPLTDFLHSGASISPDGSTLATAVWAEEKQIVLEPVAGGDQTILASGSFGNRIRVHPAWSRDGKRLVFSLDQLYVINIDGTGMKQLTFSGDNVQPVWSPDGTRVAFATGDYPHIEEINVIDLDTMQTIKVADGYQPTWSPGPGAAGDGERIAFIGKVENRTEIFIVNADGSGLTQLTRNPSNDICLH